MRLIYATGSQRQLEFAVAPGPAAVPRGARVMAVCDGGRVEGRIDGNTFDGMTDQEYYTLQSLITDARRSELRGSPNAAGRGLRQLLRRFLSA